MPAKLERCVKHVKESKEGRQGRVNSWAVCVVSTGQKPHKKKVKK